MDDPLGIFIIIGIFALGLVLGATAGLLLARIFGGARNEQATARIIEHTEQRLAETNRERINAMLEPFRVQIETLSRDVRESSRSQSDLEGQLKNMNTTYQQVSQQAENLTRALKGDPQTRGKWGEMLLGKVLENSGLREGEEYKLQANPTPTKKAENATVPMPSSCCRASAPSSSMPKLL